MSLTFHFFLLPNSKIQQETRNWEKVCVRERNVDFPLVLPNLWCVAVKTIFSNNNNNNRNTYFKAINYFIIIIDANKTNYVFLEFSFDNIIYLFAIYDYIYENCSAHFFSHSWKWKSPDFLVLFQISLLILCVFLPFWLKFIDINDMLWE